MKSTLKFCKHCGVRINRKIYPRSEFCSASCRSKNRIVWIKIKSRTNQTTKSKDFRMIKGIIHMNKRGTGEGWTKCHRGMLAPRAYRWEYVTCKQCLKHKNDSSKMV